jgi:hypothetical protein
MKRKFDPVPKDKKSGKGGARKADADILKGKS